MWNNSIESNNHVYTSFQRLFILLHSLTTLCNSPFLSSNIGLSICVSSFYEIIELFLSAVWSNNISFSLHSVCCFRVIEDCVLIILHHILSLLSIYPCFLLTFSNIVTDFSCIKFWKCCRIIPIHQMNCISMLNFFLVFNKFN